MELEKAIEITEKYYKWAKNNHYVASRSEHALRTVIEAARELLLIHKYVEAIRKAKIRDKWEEEPPPDTALAPKHFKIEEGGKE